MQSRLPDTKLPSFQKPNKRHRPSLGKSGQRRPLDPGGVRVDANKRLVPRTVPAVNPNGFTVMLGRIVDGEQLHEKLTHDECSDATTCGFRNFIHIEENIGAIRKQPIVGRRPAEPHKAALGDRRVETQ